MRQTRITPEFVSFVPEMLEPGVAYVSIEYATVLHLCCCGCGSQVVTPLSPARWQLTFDGKTVSLNPSIGNWSSNCQSHYWIQRNQILWDRAFTREEITMVRERDREAILQQAGAAAAMLDQPPSAQEPKGSWLDQLKRWFKL